MKRIVLVFLFFIVSCSPLELSRLFGAGTRRFREQGKIYSKTFDMNLPSCYEQITRELRKMEVSFSRGGQKEGFLITNNFTKVFPQCNTSTAVAIFFTELSKSKVQVEVSSLNYSLAEFIATEFFKAVANEKDTGN